ncbi:MAG: VOC family protein [Actinomycetota bacterium]
MTVSFGYTIFYVADVPATVSFYGDAFGLSARFVTPEGDYGELETGGVTLSFVAHELAESNLVAAGGFAPLPTDGAPVGASITLLTDDVAAAVDQAVAAGARPYVGVTEKPWGQTVAYVIDPNGILIEVATPMG